MKSLIDLKSELMRGELQNLYVFTGEENLIRKIYYEKIGEIQGNLEVIDTVSNLYTELAKKPLFPRKTAYIVYNDLEYLKQKENVYERLLKLCKKKVVILVYETIPDKRAFHKVFEPYITIFNKVSDDIAVKYVNKEAKGSIIDRLFAQKMAFNCYNSYNNIVEEMNKYHYLVEDNPDHSIDAMTYACLFTDRKVVPTQKEFANAFIRRDATLLSKYIPILKEENILGYIPELYNTVVLALYLKLYGKWDGGSRAYNAGEYWGRVKEIRDFRIPYDKDELLDVRYLLYQLDLDVRRGRMPADLAWDWLIGVIL